MLNSSVAKSCTFWVTRSILLHPASSGTKRLNIAVRTIVSSLSESSSRNHDRLCSCLTQRFQSSVPAYYSSSIRSLSISKPVWKKGKKAAAASEEEEEVTSEMFIFDLLVSMFQEEVEEDKDATEEGGPKDYQDVQINVQSNRLDNVLKDGANMQRGYGV